MARKMPNHVAAKHTLRAGWSTMWIRSFLCTAFVMTLSTVFCGCALFRQGEGPPAGVWPPTPAHKGRTISVLVKPESVVNGCPQQLHPYTAQLWSDATVRAYDASGCFAKVTRGVAESELQAEVVITENGEVNIGAAVLTGLTLYLIPSSATSEMTVNTTLRDAQGNVLGTFRHTETVRFWQQVFLLFALPFNWPSSVIDDVLYDASRYTLLEACAKGAI
jgi:hypothetical protein